MKSWHPFCLLLPTPPGQEGTAGCGHLQLPGDGGFILQRGRRGARQQFLAISSILQMSLRAPIVFVGIFGSRQHRGPLSNPLAAVALCYLFISTRAGRGWVFQTARN